MRKPVDHARSASPHSPRPSCSRPAARRRQRHRRAGFRRRSRRAAISPPPPIASPATPSRRRQAVRRRPADRDAVRQHHLAQHHAGSRHRHRRLERRQIRQRGAQGHPPRRRAALSGDAVSPPTPRCRATTCSRSAPISTPFEPVHNPVVANTLPFPFNIRASMRVWDWLYFNAGRIQARSEQVGGMESRRVPGAGARPLRRLPHAEDVSGRRQRQRIPAGRRLAGLVRAQHHQ